MSGAGTPLGRAAEYRRLELAARALADASVLDNVREKHELSAARWADLAHLAERASAEHTSRTAMADASRAAKLA
jgi:hypothetical protein